MANPKASRMLTDSNALTTVAPLRAALAEAIEAGDVTHMRDLRSLGVALQMGARARNMGIEAENEAAEVVVRAERAIGGYLIAMAENGERLTRGQRSDRPAYVDQLARTDLPTLKEAAGVSDSVAQQWRRLSKMSDDDFEAEIADARAQSRRLARVNFLRKPKGPSDVALKVGSPANEGLDNVRKGTYALVGWGVDDDGDGFAHAELATMQYLATDELVVLADLIRMLAQAYTAEKARR